MRTLWMQIREVRELPFLPEEYERDQGSLLQLYALLTEGNLLSLC